MRIPEHVIDEIFLNIKELSDINFQYRVWIKYEVENYVSCFADLSDALVQDLGTKELVKANPEDYGITLEFQKELALMLFELAAYDSRKKTDIEIIRDPKWIQVTNQAKVVWDMYQKLKK